MYSVFLTDSELKSSSSLVNSFVDSVMIPNFMTTENVQLVVRPTHKKNHGCHNNPSICSRHSRPKNKQKIREKGFH